LGKYIIYASNRGFWKENSKGYTLNPSLAGVYLLDESELICGDKSRKEKKYKFNGNWHKTQINKYRKSKMEIIQRAMEGLTGDDVLEMFIDIVKERKRRNS